MSCLSIADHKTEYLRSITFTRVYAPHARVLAPTMQTLVVLYEGRDGRVNQGRGKCVWTIQHGGRPLVSRGLKDTALLGNKLDSIVGRKLYFQPCSREPEQLLW